MMEILFSCNFVFAPFHIFSQFRMVMCCTHFPTFLNWKQVKVHVVLWNHVTFFLLLHFVTSLYLWDWRWMSWGWAVSYHCSVRARQHTRERTETQGLYDLLCFVQTHTRNNSGTRTDPWVTPQLSCFYHLHFQTGAAGTDWALQVKVFSHLLHFLFDTDFKWYSHYILFEQVMI